MSERGYVTTDSVVDCNFQGPFGAREVQLRSEPLRRTQACGCMRRRISGKNKENSVGAVAQLEMFSIQTREALSAVKKQHRCSIFSQAL